MDGDDVMDFFNFSKPFERKVISAGYCNGASSQRELDTQRLPERAQAGTDYSKGYAKAEEARLINAFSSAGMQNANKSRLDDVDDDMSSMAEEDAEHVRNIRGKELMEPLFARYNFSVDSSRLGIHSSKAKILEAVRTNPVVVLEGMTGCGKTTQVPQYLLEEAYQHKDYCNIVVTQPRKIAAISIAKRVAEERSCDLGSLVGFKVGLKEKVSPDTRLVYVTTGVLLQWLINEQSMKRFTHIILDEVHEREVETDFLLILVRRLLATNSSNTKVILMSATINGMEFSQYFKIPRPGSLLAPMLSVGSSRTYDVREFYLDQIEQLQVNFTVNYDKPDICNEMYTVAGKLAIYCDRVIDRYETNAAPHLNYKTSIIMFLPGINEIDRMADELNKLTSMQGAIAEKTEFTVLKLHSLLPPDEQALVFMKPPHGHRKVILSTNIAESSITIPDIKFVIDFCLHRILVADTVNNFTTLRTQWASKNNCIQRAGRAGRVMNGRVYRLVDKHFFEKCMSQATEPEMIRCPLGNVVLKAKQLNFGQPHEILAMALSPPNLSDITNTVLQLKEMGALLRTANGVYTAMDGDLTYLGKLMAKLPIDLHLAKLVILGYMFSVLEETIIIAAGMNVKNIFYQLRTVESYVRKLRWADGSGSDGIAILIAYTMWRQTVEQGTGGNAVVWCRRAQLDRKSLMEMAELVQEIKMRLSYENVREVTGPTRVIWDDREKTIVLKVVMAGAFYPYYFCTQPMVEPDKAERAVYQEVGGRDPFSTVFLTGFDNRTAIGPLYREQIKNYISDGDRSKHDAMKIDFENSSKRVYIRFMNQRRPNDPPGRINDGVYAAVKQQQLKRVFELRVMHQEDAVELATRHNLGKWRDNEWHPRRIEIPNVCHSVVPRIFMHHVRSIVTHVEHPGKFYLRPLDVSRRTSVEVSFEAIDSKLNGSGVNLPNFPPSHLFQARQIVAGPLMHNSRRYGRAQLLREQILAGTIAWEVDFLDYGFTAVLPIGSLRQLIGPDLAPLTMLPRRVFEATLAELQSAAVNSPRGFWSSESTRNFQKLVQNRQLVAEIYSVVNQVASVVLRYCDDPEGTSINQMLVMSRDAQPSEESYLSKLDHQKRIRIQREISFDPRFRTIIENDDSDLERYIDDDERTVPLPQDLLRLRLTLHGPHSPLLIACNSMVFSGYDKVVVIESESINSVLLDPNPQDTHTKMLIAACVNESSGRRLLARQTTLMPNIPGIALLMTLIFAPTCLLKKNLDQTRVTGVLAGLGLHPDENVSIYPEHDLSLPAEVDITEEDIVDINALRYSMDSILQFGRNEEERRLGEFSIGALMVKVKEYLIKILERQRNVTTDHNDMTHNFRWTTPDMNEQPRPSKRKSNFCLNETSIFPLHDPLRLPGRDEYQRRHCAELHKLAASDLTFPDGGICCRLCMLTLEKLQTLRLHLLTRVHLDNEKKLNFKRVPSKVSPK